MHSLYQTNDIISSALQVQLQQQVQLQSSQWLPRSLCLVTSPPVCPASVTCSEGLNIWMSCELCSVSAAWIRRTSDRKQPLMADVSLRGGRMGMTAGVGYFWPCISWGREQDTCGKGTSPWLLWLFPFSLILWSLPCKFNYISLTICCQYNLTG